MDSQRGPFEAVAALPLRGVGGGGGGGRTPGHHASRGVCLGTPPWVDSLPDVISSWSGCLSDGVFDRGRSPPPSPGGRPLLRPIRRDMSIPGASRLASVVPAPAGTTPSNATGQRDADVPT